MALMALCGAIFLVIMTQGCIVSIGVTNSPPMPGESRPLP